MVRRILGTSRFLIILAVLGTFVTAAVMMAYGLLRSLALVGDMVAGHPLTTDVSKDLIVDAVSIIDVFLLGTVLYIISAGLYQLFVEADLPLPAWLAIRSIEDLKIKLTGVIVVGMLVAFLGYVVQWHGGMDLLAPGIAIAAIVLAVAVYFRFVGEPSSTAARPPDGDDRSIGGQ